MERCGEPQRGRSILGTSDGSRRKFWLRECGARCSPPSMPRPRVPAHPLRATYTEAANLDHLRPRGLAPKRAAAMRKFMLGHKVNLTPFLFPGPAAWARYGGNAERSLGTDRLADLQAQVGPVQTKTAEAKAASGLKLQGDLRMGGLNFGGLGSVVRRWEESGDPKP